jgi:TonB family protein
VKADQSTPLVIASANHSRSRNEAPLAEAPAISVASNPSLGSISLPGATARPELEKAQGIVSGGNLLKRVEPVYPLFAKQQRIQGDIVVSARITKDGTLDRLKRVKGNPVFEPAAYAALKQWRYEPYKLNGQAQDVDTTITLQFRFKQ